MQNVKICILLRRCWGNCAATFFIVETMSPGSQSDVLNAPGNQWVPETENQEYMGDLLLQSLFGVGGFKN